MGPADSGDAQRGVILAEGLEYLRISAPCPTPSSLRRSLYTPLPPRNPVPLVVIDLVSAKRKMGWRDLEYVEQQDKDFNFQCMMCMRVHHLH